MKFKKEDLYDKPLITKELIFKHYSSYDIFRYYCGEFTINRAFKSPLRDKDDNPSFSIFKHYSGELFYKDHLLHSGDFVKFVRSKWSLDYNEALSKVGIDLKLDHLYKCKNINIKSNIIKKPKNYVLPKHEIERHNISIKSRHWQEYDFKYWSQFGITKQSLRKFKVVPISHAFFNDKIQKLDKYAYAFLEFKDNKVSYTIYQPFNKNYKWRKDHDSSTWYCWDQLPLQGDTLIITKARKDIMSIWDVLNIPATGLQNEKILPKPQIIDELKERFKNIYLWYDNDYDKDINWGRDFGQKFAEKYKIDQIEIPSGYESKDFSDLVKNKGKIVAKEVYNDLINNILPF